jgi:hypothetical protein
MTIEYHCLGETEGALAVGCSDLLARRLRLGRSTFPAQAKLWLGYLTTLLAFPIGSNYRRGSLEICFDL